MPVVTVPRVLREKLGEEGVDALVELLNQAQAQQKNTIIEFVEEKFERRLTEEISALRNELKADISALREEMTRNYAALREKMAQNHASIIKWMFIFWVGQLGMIVGILFAFFK